MELCSGGITVERLDSSKQEQEQQAGPSHEHLAALALAGIAQDLPPASNSDKPQPAEEEEEGQAEGKQEEEEEAEFAKAELTAASKFGLVLTPGASTTDVALRCAAAAGGQFQGRVALIAGSEWRLVVLAAERAKVPIKQGDQLAFSRTSSTELTLQHHPRSPQVDGETQLQEPQEAPSAAKRARKRSTPPAGAAPEDGRGNRQKRSRSRPHPQQSGKGPESSDLRLPGMPAAAAGAREMPVAPVAAAAVAVATSKASGSQGTPQPAQPAALLAEAGVQAAASHGPVSAGGTPLSRNAVQQAPPGQPVAATDVTASAVPMAGLPLPAGDRLALGGGNLGTAVGPSGDRYAVLRGTDWLSGDDEPRGEKSCSQDAALAEGLTATVPADKSDKHPGGAGMDAAPAVMQNSQSGGGARAPVFLPAKIDIVLGPNLLSRGEWKHSNPPQDLLVKEAKEDEVQQNKTPDIPLSNCDLAAFMPSPQQQREGGQPLPPPQEVGLGDGQVGCNREPGRGSSDGARTAAQAGAGECKPLLPQQEHRVDEQLHQQAQHTPHQQQQPPMPQQQLGRSQDPRRGRADIEGPLVQLAMPDELVDDDKGVFVNMARLLRAATAAGHVAAEAAIAARTKFMQIESGGVRWMQYELLHTCFKEEKWRLLVEAVTELAGGV
ncbi:hypothetical protein N2152v2_010278 [Parachlorella kessleri]